jgi:vitamin B12 transporter
VDAWASATVGLGARGRVDLVANNVQREQGLPSVRLFSSLRARVARSRRLVALTARVGSGDDGFEITTSTAAIVAHAGYDDPLAEAGLGTSKVDIDATRVEQVALVRWSPSEHLSVTPVARASIERLAIDPLLEAPAHVERVFSRAALQGEWSLSDEVKLRALGSGECNGTSRNGLPPWSLPGDPSGPTHGSKACNQFEPILRMGAQIGAGRLVFLATIGRYARVPTLTELYGLSGVVLGNTALEPEIGLSAELGVRADASKRGALRGASVDLFGFVRSASHLITYQRASIISVRPFNVASGRVAGLELLASYRPAPFALVELAATLLDPRNTAENRPVNQILPYQPRLVLAPRVELGSTLAAPPIDSGKISFCYFFESSRYADLAGLEVIPAQGSLDAEGEVSVLDGHLTLRGRLANLLDQTRKDLIGYPLPGRTAYAALEAQW